VRDVVEKRFNVLNIGLSEGKSQRNGCRRIMLSRTGPSFGYVGKLLVKPPRRYGGVGSRTSGEAEDKWKDW
jgi:hypothetical protein